MMRYGRNCTNQTHLVDAQVLMMGRTFPKAERRLTGVQELPGFAVLRVPLKSFLEVVPFA